MAELYYSIYHWTGGPERTADRVAALRTAGVGGLEFGSTSRSEPGLEAAAREAAPPVLLHNYFPPPAEPFVFNLSSPREDIRERSAALARRAIEISGAIGAPCYGIHAGFAVDPGSFDGISFEFRSATGAERSEAFVRFVDALPPLISLAARHGVRLLVENNVCPVRLRDRLLLQLPAEFSDLYNALGTAGAGLGILLDSGHLQVTARTFGFDAMEFVAMHRERIVGLHLHDNDGLEDRHGPIVRNGLALRILRACDGARWVTLETNCATLEDVTDQLAVARTVIGT